MSDNKTKADLYDAIDSDEDLSDEEKREIYFAELEKEDNE